MPHPPSPPQKAPAALAALAGAGNLGCLARLSFALLVLLAAPGRPRGAAAQPSSNGDCALLVPLEEVRRGKGSFLSGCETLSDTYLGGCWTQAENFDTVGCQTCYIAEEAFSGALFPAFFSEELDPCPTSVDYGTLYENEHGTLSLVTAASLTSTACPDGWLYSSETDHCYFKSPNTAKAADQEDATAKCAEEGAWVIAIESEAENDFFVNNMLWIGFFGESYTGMVKGQDSDSWSWPADAIGEGTGTYDCVSDYSDWLEGPDLGCASDYNGGAEGSSCMEIFPYQPKEWNPFSCMVGKHYVCEMASTGDGVTEDASPAPTASSTVGSTTATEAPSTSPATPATPAPTPIVSQQPTVAPTMSIAPSGGGVDGTPGPFGESVGFDETPSPSSGGSEGGPQVTERPSAAPVGDDVGGGDATPSPSGSAEEGTASPAASSSWSGDNLLTVTKRGLWGAAEYYLYHVEGDAETAIAQGLTKEGSGTEEDDYLVKAGCYRLQVTVGASPSDLTWDITGGDPARDRDSTSGEGLDGTLLTVGGGVCDVGSCQAACLADYFTLEEGRVSAATNACSGYTALIAGVCTDVCDEDEGEDPAAFQEICVNTGCDPEMVCGVEGGSEALEIDFGLEVEALLSGGTMAGSSSGGGSDTMDEFQAAVGLWLGVDSSYISVIAVNGEDAENEGGDTSTSSSRRRRLSPARKRSALARSQRSLEGGGSSSPSSSNTTESQFTRYVCTVQPPNATLDAVTALESSADEGTPSASLGAWLMEVGSTWTDDSVIEVETEVVQSVSVAEGYAIGSSDQETESGSNSEAWYEEDLATGAIAASAVVIVGVAIIAFFMCRSKRAAKTRSRSRSVSGDVDGRLTHDFEGGGIYVPSDADQQNGILLRTGTYNKKHLPSKDSNMYGDAYQNADFAVASAAVVIGAAAASADPVAVNGATIVTGGSPGRSTDGTVTTTTTSVFVETDEPPSSVSSNTSASAGAVGYAKRPGAGTPPIHARSGERSKPRGTPGYRSFGVAGCGGGGDRGEGDSSDEDAGGEASRVGSTRSEGRSTAARVDLASLASLEHSAGVGMASRVQGQKRGQGAGNGSSSSSGPKRSYSRSMSNTSKRSTGSNQTDAQAVAAGGVGVAPTKVPNVRGPSGALASLRFGQSMSMEYEDIDDLDGSQNEYEGSDYGDSEAGSRFMPASGSGLGVNEGYASNGSRRDAIAEARIRALQLSDRARVEVTTAPQGTGLATPDPFSPGTDWALAQDLAPTPGRGGGRARNWFASPGATKKQFNKSTPPRAPRVNGDAPHRPTTSRTGSFQRYGSSSASPGGRGGVGAEAYDSDAASRVYARGTRSAPRGRGRLASHGRDDDGDYDSREAGFPMFPAQEGGVGGGSVAVTVVPGKVAGGGRRRAHSQRE